MKNTARHLAHATALLAVPVLAQAHPGHDGPHDFAWDFAHLASHPLATTLCLALAGIAVLLGWGILRHRRAEARRAQ